MGQDFGATRTVKALKEHRCEECTRTIRKFEHYQRHAGSWEGDFFTWVSCAHCVELRAAIDKVDMMFYEGAFGGVGEWIAQGLWREVEVTWQQRLNLLRLTRQYERKWTNPDGTLLPVPEAPDGPTNHTTGML